MSKRAFTLVELLVVVAIIGILATVVIMNVSGVQAKSRDAKRKSDVVTIKKSIDSFYIDNHRYPLCYAAGNLECKFSIIDDSALAINGDSTSLRATDRASLTAILPVFPTDPLIKKNNKPAYYAYADIDENHGSLGSKYGILVAMEVLAGNLIDSADTNLVVDGKTYYPCKTSIDLHPSMWDPPYPICDF